MSLYERAKRHAWFMLLNTFFGFVFIALVDQYFGHSTWAFVAVIVALIAFNIRVLRFRCPRCDSNLFYRGWIAVPWPNRTCSRCGLDLTEYG